MALEVDGQPRDPRRALWRSVALPSEHGGWSLTSEPVVLGLLVDFSSAGLCLGMAAMLAFLARTPLKVVMVDQWRHRSTPRTRLARRILLCEIGAIVGLVVVAAMCSKQIFWPPFIAAAPLVVLELSYDMRSRGRRLIPELAGTIGMGSVAAAIVLAGGSKGEIALALWCVIAARDISAIPYVRTQVLRTRSKPPALWPSDLAQICAVATAGTGWALGSVPSAAVIVIAVAATLSVVLVRLPARPPVHIGIEQLFVGVIVVITTAAAMS